MDNLGRCLQMPTSTFSIVYMISFTFRTGFESKSILKKIKQIRSHILDAKYVHSIKLHVLLNKTSIIATVKYCSLSVFRYLKVIIYEYKLTLYSAEIGFDAIYSAYILMDFFLFWMYLIKSQLTYLTFKKILISF